MLTQTAAQGMPVVEGSHLARKQGQEIRTPRCTGKPNAGRPGHVRGFQVGIFPSQAGACPAQKAEIYQGHHFRNCWRTKER